MAQLGIFDADRRPSALSAKGDPLDAIDALMPWESFRAEIETVVLTSETERKSIAGRKPIDAIVMFRMPLLQSRVANGGFLFARPADRTRRRGGGTGEKAFQSGRRNDRSRSFAKS